MSEEAYFKLGNEFPYDLGVPEVDWAHRAARGIVKNLMDRRGIKNTFYDIAAYHVIEFRAEEVDFDDVSPLDPPRTEGE